MVIIKILIIIKIIVVIVVIVIISIVIIIVMHKIIIIIICTSYILNVCILRNTQRDRYSHRCLYFHRVAESTSWAIICLWTLWCDIGMPRTWRYPTSNKEYDFINPRNQLVILVLIFHYYYHINYYYYFRHYYDY